jgi:hypothetical protein
LHTVIAVSGTRIQLADTGGHVTEAGLTDLLATGDFEAVSVPAQGPVPPSTLLDGLPEAVAAEALWWEQHIVEVLRGIPPQAPAGTRPKPEYDPDRVSLTRREKAKAAELTAAGRPVTASAITKRRRRYEARGLAGMVDHRIDKPVTAHGRADPLVVEALQQAIAEATQESSRTATYLFWRTGQILEAAHGPGGRSVAVAAQPLPVAGEAGGGQAHHRIGSHPPVAGRPPGRAVRRGGRVGAG